MRTGRDIPQIVTNKMDNKAFATENTEIFEQKISYFSVSSVAMLARYIVRNAHLNGVVI